MNIATSFIVGGLLLISIITLNIQVSQFGNSSTLDITTKQRFETLTDLLENDIRKIGQDLPGGTQPFITLQEKTIRFRSDTFFGDDRPFSVVTWDFNDTKEYSASSNPNDFELTRQDNVPPASGANKEVFAVTHFKVSYLNHSGTEVANLPADQNLVRQIKIEFIMESEVPVMQNASGENVYEQLVYSKSFYPPNLQF
ncbi:hypothetical protein [Gracilimonas mengyeensis]|nr:hypothetical protein [Gracilimonas mengyeensis]